MKYLAISAGCAECWSVTDGPLMISEVFDTFEEAKGSSWLRDKEWQEHPQGGWYAHSGQGADWIFEVPDGISLKPPQ